MYYLKYFRECSLLIFQELVRRGIPGHVRGIAWQMLSGAAECAEKARYTEFLETESACEKMILRDIARTYPEHEMFKKKDGMGQESLFNVMKAYSAHQKPIPGGRASAD